MAYLRQSDIRRIVTKPLRGPSTSTASTRRARESSMHDVTLPAGPVSDGAANPPWQVLKDVLQAGKQPVVAGHQASLFDRYFGVFPIRPNTLRAFEYALKRGVRVFECDLRVTRDHEAAVFHDEVLDKWTRSEGKVRDHTLAQLKRVRYRFNSESITSFDRVLQWAAEKRAAGIGVILIPELKDVAVAEPTVRLIQKYHAHSWVIVQAKSGPSRYNAVRALDPNVVLTMAPSGHEELAWALAKNDPALLIIEVHPNTITPDWPDRIRQAQKLVLADSFHFVESPLNPHEVFGAGGSCSEALEATTADILVTNRPGSCRRATQATGVPTEPTR